MRNIKGSIGFKAVCPNNPDHKEFITTAHVMDEWLVDENGDFLDTLRNLETVHGPDPQNIWTCNECGARAVIK